MPTNIIMLYAAQARVIGTVADHLDAFDTMSEFNVVQVDSAIAGRVDLEINRFDAVVFHYSLVLESDSYISPAMRARLRDYTGLKVLFIQDEMRWVDRTVDAILDMGISVVFSVTNPDARDKIYADERLANVRFETTLTGFVPENLIHIDVPAYEDRTIDVGYRARKLAAWYGQFAREKWLISERFEKDARTAGLNCDLSSAESDRIYGDAWIKFMTQCKATLGVESGSSFVDFTGDVYPQVEAFEAANPNASFEEISDRFLEGRDGEITIRVISPRCFEAAALRTLMIMYEGKYSGILEAGRHYVVLNRDHSNMDEVVSILRDPARAKPIIDAAYNEIACSGKWTFRTFIKHFDRVISEEAVKHPAPALAISNPFSTTDLMNMKDKFRRLDRRRQRQQAITLFAVRLAYGTARGVRDRLPRKLQGPATHSGRRLFRYARALARQILNG